MIFKPKGGSTMKIPITPYAIATQQQVQINREFLLSQGWKLKNEFPLFESFEHSKDINLICAIGLYGDFSIVELHWCNKTPERQFTTINPSLTHEDYFKIISMLRIDLPADYNAYLQTTNQLKDGNEK